MKTRIILFVLLPCLSFYLGFSQLGPNLAKYELEGWWTLDDPEGTAPNEGINWIVADPGGYYDMDTSWFHYVGEEPETALEFINRIDKQEYQHDLILDEVGALCPWQSWRLQPYFSYQVDVILSPDEFDAFEPRLLDEDLMYFIHGGNRDALNITERGYFAQIHRPGFIGKLMRDYRFVNPEHALYYKGTSLNGWHIRILKNGMAIAARDLPNNRIHVSMARFIEYDPF